MTRSAKFELVKKYYDRGLWSAERVMKAVEKGWITQAECDEILGADSDALSDEPRMILA